MKKWICRKCREMMRMRMRMKGFYGYLWLWFSITIITTMHKLTKEPSGVAACVYKKFVVGSLLPNWHPDVISPIRKPDPRSINKLCALIICCKNLKKNNLISIMQSSFTHTKSGTWCLLTSCFGLQQQWCSSTWMSIQILDAAVVVMMGYP